MSDDAQKNHSKRNLSEISHLFLSSVRDRQTNGAPRPQRTPPRSDESIDMTPEEFAQIYGGAAEAAGEAPRKAVPIAAVISAHLNGKQFDRVKQYARHLAGQIGRVGLIEVDASEFRLMCFDPAAPDAPGVIDVPPECQEPRQMTDALHELNCDVEHWLLLLPNPRTPEARAILREVNHWVLLSTCDHDGIVSSYRMLKGLAETHRPTLSLALLDAADEAQASHVFQKLCGVCLQFLDWPVEAEPAVQPNPSVNEHLVLLYRPTRDKAQMAIAPQWDAISEFIAAGKNAVAQQIAAPAQTEIEAPMPEEHIEQPQRERASREPVVDLGPIPMPTIAFAPAASNPVAPTPISDQPADSEFDDVIDLPDHDTSGQSILSAMLRSSGGDLVECPLRPPMCPEARLAVGRDRGIILLAVARQGLSQLRSIGQAYRWLCENQTLIRMALPQFAIDSEQSPILRLLVDRCDLSADILQPLMQADHVRVQAYRKLRWGERTGVFLEAA